MRIAIGPVDPAGVGAALAHGLRRRGHEVEVVHVISSPYGYPLDRELHGRGARVRYALREAPRCDVLHVLGGGSWLAFGDLLLARGRRRVAIIQYNGSDCRTSDIARRLHPARARIVDPAGDRTVRLRRRLGGLTSTAALVQDLELVDYVEPSYRRVYVAPFAIDLEALDQAAQSIDPPRSEGMRIFHAPSSRLIKGSDQIEAAVAEASKDLAIDYSSVTNRPHRETLRKLAAADVVIDQLNAETPGVFAAEAMALGKPVLCEHDPAKLASFARPSPAVRTTAATLAADLAELCRDRERRRELGEAGRDYARRVHAPERAAEAAERVYAHSPGAAPGVYEATPEGVRPLTER